MGMAFRMVGRKFNFGIDIDDMWRFAGIPDPPSIVVPFLLSRPTITGKFALPGGREKTRSEHDGQGHADSLISQGNSHDIRRLTRSVALFLKDSGIDYVRCWFPWSFFEPRIGSKFSYPLDYFVHEMKKADIGLVAVLGDGYSRFIPPNAKTDDLDSYVRQLSGSSRKIVRHYKSRIDAWQIENEPNAWPGHALAGWRSGSIWFDEKSQGKILSALYGIVRKEAPGSEITINIDYIGLDTDWKRYARYCDVMGIDFYPGYANPFNTSLSIAKRIVGEAYAATRMPIYIIETGYPSGPKVLAYSEQRQKEYVRSACVSAFSDRRVSGLGLYRFADSYWNSFPPMENYFGLLTAHGRAKPAWNEYVRQIGLARRNRIKR